MKPLSDEWVPCWKCKFLLMWGVMLQPTRWGTTFEDSSLRSHVRLQHGK